jgi:MFS family permease
MTDTLDNRKRWLALMVLCLGVLMIVLDTTIVNVALPSIRTDLGFTETSLVWVVNAYMLTFGGFLLLGGRLGDLYGHRKLFLIGLVLFTVASLACGIANSQGVLVAARAVQGLGGAVVSAVSLSLIMNLFTEPADRAKAMGVYGFVCAGGGSIGVLLGGLLTSSLSWHWIFLVNLPIGVAVYALCVALLPNARGQAHGEKLDVAGAITVTLSLMLAVYGVVNGNEAGWGSTQTLGLLGAAVVLLAIFITIEARVQHPLMPLGPLSPAQRVGRQRGGRAVGGGDVRVVLHLGALHAAGAELHADADRPGLPAGQHHHGGVLARPLGQAGDALRHPQAAGRRAVARGHRPGAVRARTGQRQLRGRRAARDDAARPGRGHGVQPGAARGHERGRSRRFGPRLGRGQHRLHDGRRARPGRAGQRGGGAHHRSMEAAGAQLPLALTGGYNLAFLVGAVFAALAGLIGVLLLRTAPPAQMQNNEEAAPRGAASESAS